MRNAQEIYFRFISGSGGDYDFLGDGNNATTVNDVI